MAEWKEDDRYETPEIVELGTAEDLTLGNPMGGWPDHWEQWSKVQNP
jgi:hypothetical protein